MKLEYSVNLEDIITFNQNHIDASPQMRRKMTVAKYIWSFTPLIAIMAITHFEGTSPDKAIKLISFVTLCISAPIFLFQPAFFRWLSARQIRKLYGSGQSYGVLGSHSIEIVGKDLVTKSETDENRFALVSINRIVKNDDYTYIYTSASLAHVIPRNGVVSGDYEQFVAKVEKLAKVD